MNSFINNLHSDTQIRNGSFLFDLINKMEKKAILKGKSVKNGTSIKSNFSKIFTFLKKFEKFNQRFLVHGSEYYLVNSHFDFFWGFMTDIYYFYKGLVSKYDTRFKSKKSKNSKKFLNSIDRKQLKVLDDGLNKVQKLQDLINKQDRIGLMSDGSQDGQDKGIWETGKFSRNSSRRFQKSINRNAKSMNRS